MSTAPFPTRDDLVSLKLHLEALQLACELQGHWPGACTLPELERHGPPWDHMMEACGEYARIRAESLAQGSPNAVCVKRWPPFHARLIRQAFAAVDVVLHAFVAELLPDVGYRWDVSSTTEDDQEFVFSVTKASTSGRSSSTDAWTVSGEVAASHARCVRLLGVLLEHPVSAFVPSERQRAILEALNGRAMTLDALAHELRVERSTLCQVELSELQRLRLVDNQRRRGGYYRPDAPPE